MPLSLFIISGRIDILKQSLANKTKSSAKDILIKSSGVIIFLVLWEIGPRLGWADKQFVPAFSTVVNELISLQQAESLQCT
jgi:NitT/TauT family transport system permease protein